MTRWILSLQDTKQGKRGSFSEWEEECRVAVLSGDEERLEAASGRWLEAARQSGCLTPQMLEDYRHAALQLAEKLRDEAPTQPEEEVGGPSDGDLMEEAPYSQAGTLSLQSWREWTHRLLLRLSRAVPARQSQEKAKMGDIAGFIEQNYQSELSLQDVAKRFFVSREYVSRKFKQELGVNFSDYISSIRIEKAKLLMANPHLRIAKIAEMVGFHDEKYFSKVFKKQEGVSPKVYRTQMTE
ncbi:helix-turn-helix transcriptional regulator [Paenibacillus sp. N4]|uniref:helix-turn-helix transcriptional regulator n=1 Tax=Paenibacillus vietnamensis TaxID=2590547 RepID=UPI001CD05B39|nr:helix-turn-helix transcriptional regulator [Paenibacillus vietnamensis]MCA0756147.1 helix-turn-helix transcriptional regulator [Paenibacillus vietnamensis]